MKSYQMMRALVLAVFALGLCLPWTRSDALLFTTSIFPNACVSTPQVITTNQAGAISADADGTTATSVSVALPGTVGNGDTVPGIVTWHQPTGVETISNVTDDKGNTYTVGSGGGAIQVIAAHSQAVAIFYGLHLTNAPQTITVNFSAAVDYRRVAVSDLKNIVSSAIVDAGPLGAQQAAVGAGTNALTTGNITTTIAKDAIWAGTFITDYSTFPPAALTPGTGYTQDAYDAGANVAPLMTEFKVQSSAGAVAGTFTTNQTLTGVTFAVAFKANSACATPAPPSTGFTSVSSLQLHGVTFGTCCNVNGSGQDGSFSATANGEGRLDTADTDTQIPIVAAVGFTSIAIHTQWNWNSTGDTWLPTSGTETRAGVRRAVADICNAVGPSGHHPDLWFKGNHFYNGGGIGGARATAVPTNATTWQNNILAMWHGWLDDVEANAPSGCHTYGIILTSEMDNLTAGCCNTAFANIIADLHARYPNLKFVTDMPTAGYGGGGCPGPCGFVGATSGYLQAGWDAVAFDAYTPTQASSGTICTSAPSQASTATLNGTSRSTCNGSNNSVDATGGNGLGGITGSLMGAAKNKIAGAGVTIPWIDGENGAGAVAGAATCPACGNFNTSGSGTTQGFTEKRNWVLGMMQAQYQPAYSSTGKGVAGFGGSFLWQWAPVNDINTAAYFGFGTNNFELNQNCTLLNNIAAQLGGAYNPSPAACIPGS